MRPFTFFLLLLATRIDATGTDVTNNLFSDLGPYVRYCLIYVAANAARGSWHYLASSLRDNS